MRMIFRTAILIVALTTPACAGTHVSQAEAPQLVLTGVGRFAVLADLASIRREGDVVQMRALQVAEEGFAVGDQAYWGGWSRWRFDCAARTADRLDFSSVKAGGAEGPATPETAPPYPAAPGSDADKLLAVACDPNPVGETDADNVEDAVEIGRAALRQAG